MISRTFAIGSVPLLLLAAGAAADVTVLPTTAHVTFNAIPFGAGSPHTCVFHQVFDGATLGALSGGLPIQIGRLAFSPGTAGTYTSDVTIRLAYTNRVPGATPPSGLDIPVAGGGGAPNAVGPVTVFFAESAFMATFAAPNPASFQMQFSGTTPFEFDPAQGRNLLLEVVANTNAAGNISPGVSRTGANPVASRAWSSNLFGNGTDLVALRVEFTYTFGGGTPCYPDCDASHALNVNDFVCFQAAFAAGAPYADCNNDQQQNVNDFICFQSAFAAGCSAP